MTAGVPPGEENYPLDIETLLELPVNALDCSLGGKHKQYQTKLQNHSLEDSLDAKIEGRIDFETLREKPQLVESAICNIDRSFGTLIGYNVTKRYLGIDQDAQDRLHLAMSFLGADKPKRGLCGQSRG